MTATTHWPPIGHAWHDAVAHERALIQHGRYHEALEFGETMYAAATRAGTPDGVLAMLWARRGDLLRRGIDDFQGSADAYTECLRRLTAICAYTDCVQVLIIPLHTLAAIQLHRGRIGDAVDLLSQADAALEQATPMLHRRFTQLHATLLRAWAAAAAGDRTTARDLYLQTRQSAATLHLAPNHQLLRAIGDGLRWVKDPAAQPPELFLWDEPAMVRSDLAVLEYTA